MPVHTLVPGPLTAALRSAHPDAPVIAVKLLHCFADLHLFKLLPAVCCFLIVFCSVCQSMCWSRGLCLMNAAAVMSSVLCQSAALLCSRYATSDCCCDHVVSDQTAASMVLCQFRLLFCSCQVRRLLWS